MEMAEAIPVLVQGVLAEELAEEVGMEVAIKATAGLEEEIKAITQTTYILRGQPVSWGLHQNFRLQ